MGTWSSTWGEGITDIEIFASLFIWRLVCAAFQWNWAATWENVPYSLQSAISQICLNIDAVWWVFTVHLKQLWILACVGDIFVGHTSKSMFSIITWASKWYWLTVGHGLLSLQQIRVEGEFSYSVSSLSFFFLSPLSLSFISTNSSISLLPFFGRWHKMTHKGWHAAKVPQPYLLNFAHTDFNDMTPLGLLGRKTATQNHLIRAELEDYYKLKFGCQIPMMLVYP